MAVLAPTRRPGRPTSTRKEEVAVGGTVVPFPGKPPCGGTGGFSAEEEKTPREGMENPPVRSPIEFSIEFSEEEEERESGRPQVVIFSNAISSKATDLSALNVALQSPRPSCRHGRSASFRSRHDDAQALRRSSRSRTQLGNQALVPDYPGRSGCRHKSLISFAPSHSAGDVAWRAMRSSSRMV